MKTLLLFCSILLISTVSISFTHNSKVDLSRDQTFITSVREISALPAMDSKNAAEMDEAIKRIASSIAILQSKYPDLLNAATTSVEWKKAIDKLATDQHMNFLCDTCLRDFVKAMFSCFCSSVPRATVNACLATACANYQACKEGGNR